MIIIGAVAEGMVWRDVYPKEDIPYCDIMTNSTEIMETTRTIILARQKEQCNLLLPLPLDFLKEGMEMTAEIFFSFGLFAHVLQQSAATSFKVCS